MLKIISGGQTGVDQAALRAAKAAGHPTGGWAPNGWMTEDGPAPWLGDEYGLEEHPDQGYPARTRANVELADATIWIGPTGSAGYRATAGACNAAGKPFIACAALSSVLVGVLAHSYREPGFILNVAGNRESRRPGIGRDVEIALAKALRELAKV